MKCKDVVRVIKKGKTRGRPSKYEKNASAVMSYFLERNKDKINKLITDAILFGNGQVFWEDKRR